METKTLRTFILSTGAVAALALVAACSPKTETAADTAAAGASDAAATAAAGPTSPGGAVSPPAANEAVDTAATTETDVAAASNSFTEGQAKGHLENAGYSNVGALTKTPEGLWTGTATKDGKTMTVSVDFKGAVSAK